MAAYPPPPPPPFHYDPRQQRQFDRDQFRNQAKAQARAQKEAFRAQRQLYRDQIRANRRSSILGPLLFVAIGTIALLVRSGRWPLGSFVAWYTHWWPLLLVAAGLVLVAEWAVDQTRAASGTSVSRHIGGGIVTVLLLLAFFGFTFRTVHSPHDFFTRGLSINPDNLAELFGDKHDLAPQILDQTLPPGTALAIANPHGDINITGQSGDGQIHLTINKQVYSSDSDRDSKGDLLTPQFTTSAGILTISVPAVDGGSADLTLLVPEAAALTLTANHGDISVTGMKSAVNLTTNHGDVQLQSIGGNVSAHINHSDSSFSAHNLAGDLTLKGNLGDTTLSDITGRSTLEGDFYGDTHFERLLGPVSFQTSKTHFTLAALPGSIDVEHSDISGTRLTGPIALRVHSRNINFDGITGDLDLSNSNGSVDLTGIAPLGNISVDNSNGAINLTVPAGAGLSVNASTQGGQLESGLALTPTTSGSTTSVIGTVGDGKSRINLRTTHADLSIHKADSAQASNEP